MVIAVASGKGGTGKTTVAVNLALSLSDVQFIDADVEEPNANLFLKVDLQKLEDVAIPIPQVNTNCSFCGRCAEFCQYNAIVVIPNKVIVFPELCHGCGGCKLVCPNNAIAEQPHIIGYIEHGKTDTIEFYHGVLKPGEPSATPIIRQLKRRIDPTRTVIIDVAPGIGCTVIESLRGVDFCLLVTEPTPFGLYDLDLTVNVIKQLHIPCGVVINRSTIGDERVQHYCEAQNIPLLLQIPYDDRIAQLYSQGIPFVSQFDSWCDKFRNLFDKINEATHRNKW